MKESTTEAVSVCHSAPQETPVPTYVLFHGHTQKKELVDGLYYLGLTYKFNC